MGSIYARGTKLWLRFKQPDGEWACAPSGCSVGEEDKAWKKLEELEARLKATTDFNAATEETGPVTIERYALRWIEKRKKQDIATVADEEGRLKNHVLPLIGSMLVADVRPRHVRDMVLSLRNRKTLRGGEPLAPRTVRHAYATFHTMMKDAVIDELIDRDPCVLKRGVLPGKRDKDPNWRSTAIFTRSEVERLISDVRIPEDRRTLYAILFLAATRFGEAAARRWRDYDANATPLGKLAVTTSFSTRLKKEKLTKTENPREMPVHPTLASILAAWKLGGWVKLFGRQPELDDLIVPSREGRYRNVNHGLKRFYEDLERIGLRPRRQHDTRRTFITLAQADGGRKDILRWATHGPTGDIMDAYTSLPWEIICAEVGKLKISLLEGKVIELPKSVISGGSEPKFATPLATDAARQTKTPGILSDPGASSLRGGRDSNPRPSA